MTAADGGAGRRRVGLAFLVLGTAALVLWRLMVGREVDDGGRIVVTLGWPEAAALTLRMTATWSALLAGAALGLSGLAFQVLLRNPLASPWILGISSGAGFGMMLALALVQLGGIAAGLGQGLLWGAGLPSAALGALLALALVAMLARAMGGFDPVGLVLGGVIVGAIFGAGTMLLQYTVPSGVRGDLIGWMMGRIPEIVPGWLLVVGGILVLASLGAGLFGRRMLDAACLGEDEARSVGVPIDGLRIGLFLVGGGLAAFSVVLVGPIAFIGLLGPHAARLLGGPTHGRLIPTTAVCGGSLLLAAEAIRQMIDLGWGRLPVGVVTVLIGGPAFLWLLLRRRSVL
ncbi:MAG: iron ABC transporter permease [Planctomycetota bacterium]|nr:iron ABC transporter permease [Planctomycetota bacterium]